MYSFFSSFDMKRNSEFEMAASVAVGHFPSYMDQVLPRDITTCIGNVYVTKATLENADFRQLHTSVPTSDSFDNQYASDSFQRYQFAFVCFGLIRQQFALERNKTLGNSQMSSK